MTRNKIIDKVLKRKEEINAPPPPSGPSAFAINQELAQAAVIGGIKSTEWETYMKQFVDIDPATDKPFQDQLNRLTAKDGNMSPALAKNRAYLVSNGMCGDFTRQHFEETVATIDAGLENNCESTPPQ